MQTFAVPLFGSRIFYTRDRQEAQEWQDRRGFDLSLASVDGICCPDNGNILVYTKTQDAALLAHECLHAAYAVLDYSGIESRDEELLAHLMQWVLAECLKRS